MAVSGCDICPEAVAEAQKILPAGGIAVLDITELLGITESLFDVTLSVGVLVHQHPDLVPGILTALLVLSRTLVLVEEDGHGEVAKGPRQWGAERNTGEYIMWRIAMTDTIARLGVSNWTTVSVPLGLQAPGAKQVWIVRK